MAATVLILDGVLSGDFRDFGGVAAAPHTAAAVPAAAAIAAVPTVLILDGVFCVCARLDSLVCSSLAVSAISLAVASDETISRAAMSTPNTSQALRTILKHKKLALKTNERKKNESTDVGRSCGVRMK
ncbi:hypothetical protein Taro_050257 [Colocasia esculenta]|uniref:Uncharacterized protein n=1 Tax=Colocasia esculenta TaxID=4460 RepID=A0A843XD91_COLES|nr:hypothetical protein [Colocasia esculenta]